MIHLMKNCCGKKMMIRLMKNCFGKKMIRPIRKKMIRSISKAYRNCCYGKELRMKMTCLKMKKQSCLMVLSRSKYQYFLILLCRWLSCPNFLILLCRWLSCPNFLILLFHLYCCLSFCCYYKKGLSLLLDYYSLVYKIL